MSPTCVMDDASCLNALDATLKYVAKGWPVFPCNAHKQPLLKDWPNTASIDPEQITAWCVNGHRSFRGSGHLKFPRLAGRSAAPFWWGWRIEG
jgi:hypothetical protein